MKTKISVIESQEIFDAVDLDLIKGGNYELCLPMKDSGNLDNLLYNYYCLKHEN